MPLTLEPTYRQCRHQAPDYPEPHVKPGREGWCVKCDGQIHPDWAISLDNTRDFLRRLADATPNPGESFERFEAQVILRQQQGERTFRQSAHGKDMQAEGNQEATDATMYAIIGLLQERRAHIDENLDIALEIASCAARIFELNEIWKSKEHGAAHAAKAHEERP